MSEPVTYTCRVYGCDTAPPDGCYLCDECFERYAKNDPRMPIGSGPVSLNFTITSGASSTEFARKVVEKLTERRLARNLPPPPDAA